MTDERLQARLADLKQEYEVGERRLRELSQQELVLRETLLRISGAIQVLDELSGSSDDSSAAASPGPTGNGQVRHQPDTMVVP